MAPYFFLLLCLTNLFQIIPKCSVPEVSHNNGNPGTAKAATILKAVLNFGPSLKIYKMS
jgi:hypothetical protein